MKIGPLPGIPSEPSTPFDIPELITANYSGNRDPAVAAQRVFFGTSVHRSAPGPHFRAIGQRGEGTMGAKRDWKELTYGQ
jgi:hypothetical protein